jgi:hypothetical protein
MKVIKTLMPLMVLGVASQAQALDYELGVGLGLEHTDNSLKTVNEQSELETTLYADASLTHAANEFDAMLDYSIRDINYDKDTQKDETVITGDAKLVYRQIENRLTWTLTNSRRNVVSDQQLVDVQDNRDDRAISRISPELILRPSKVDEVVLALGYGVVSYDDNEQQDSERMDADVSWNHKLSQVDTLWLGIGYQDIDFDNDASDDYEYYRAAIGYRVELSRLSYEMALGYNESDFTDETVDGGYINVVHGGRNWGISLLNELTDTSRGDNNESLSELSDYSNISAGNDVYERLAVEGSFNTVNVCTTCVLTAVLRYEDADYETLLNDNSEMATRIDFTYGLTRQLNIGGFVQYRDFSFDGGNARTDYDLFAVGLNGSYEVGRHVTVSAYLASEERNDSDSAADYEELLGGIKLDYAF